MKNRKKKNIFNFFNKSNVTLIPNLYKDPTTEKLWNNISEEHKHKNSQLSTVKLHSRSQHYPPRLSWPYPKDVWVFQHMQSSKCNPSNKKSQRKKNT